LLIIALFCFTNFLSNISCKKHIAKFIFHAHNSTLKNAKVIAEQSSYNLLAAIPCIFKSALYLLPKQSKKGA